METSGLSASDVLALTKENEGLFGGNGFIILILFLLMLSGGFNWGGNNAMQGALTRAELYEGLNSQNTFSEFRSIQNEITNGFAGVNQSLCSGFGSVNQNISNATAGITLGMNNGFNGVQSAIADTRYAMQDCCCQIKNAIHSEGEHTRALIQSNTIQDLRDKVADKDRELQTTGLAAAMINQTNNLEAYFRTLINGGCCCNG